MQELRFVAVSEDGRYAVLAVPGRSARFTLPIDERLRAVALGQTSRLAQYEIEVESPLRPKEIQARIRAGETVEEIADAAGIAVERVRWFEGPVLAERAYMADQAQTASVRRPGDAAPSTPGPRLSEVVGERLAAFGVDPEDAQWDAKKRGDGNWQVQLTFITGGRLHVAEWVFDPRRRHVLPADDNAARMSLPGAEPLQPAAPPPGEATVTQLAPRLGAASGHAPSGRGPYGPGAPGSGGAGAGVPGYGSSVFGPVALGNNGLGSGGLGSGGLGSGGAGSGGGGLGSGGGGRARYERPGPGRPVSSEPAPQVAPASMADDGPRPAATERHPLPHHVAQEPGPAIDDHPPVSAAQASASPYHAAVSPSPAASPSAATAVSPTAGAPGGTSATPAEAPHPAAPSDPAEAAGEQAGRQGRKAARGRRSSVPSWDEIMFGSARQRD